MRSRRTHPPAVLPLLLIGCVGIVLGAFVIGAAEALLVLLGVDDGSRGGAAVTLVGQLIGLFVASVGLRFLVHWWVRNRR